MSDVGHNWDVFTTDSPYAAVLEGLPTQLALALRRLGFGAPGNLATFVDDYEGTETELEQAVSEADTTTTVIGVGAVSAYTSGDPKRRRLGKSSPLSPHSFFASSPFLLSFVWSYRSSGFYRRQEVRVRCLLAAAIKAVEGTCTAATFTDAGCRAAAAGVPVPKGASGSWALRPEEQTPPKEATKGPRPEPDHLAEEPEFVTFLRGVTFWGPRPEPDLLPEEHSEPVAQWPAAHSGPSCQRRVGHPVRRPLTFSTP